MTAPKPGAVLSRDIAIIGGGPVGLTTAIGLRQAGFSVLLIERGDPQHDWQSSRYDGRVYAIAPRSAKLLDDLGVWPGIAAARISPYAEMRVWDRHPERALRFAAADAGAAELGWIVEHSLIAARLWTALAGSDCLFPVTVDSLQLADPEQAKTTLTLSDGRVVQAGLVIAADGADSRIRELAGIDVVSWRYDQCAIVCHVSTAEPHRMTAYQRFLGTGPLAFLPLVDGRCSIVWSTDAAQASELTMLSDQAFLQRLNEASQGVLGDVLAATPRVAVPLRLLHATEYVRDGLALVGDAAHAIHPLAGQGLNLGLSDARCLIDTLTEARDARRDWRSQRTLLRYARARKAENLEMLAVTDSLSRAFGLRLRGLTTLLGLGMEAVDKLGPVKGLLMRQAASA